MTRRYHFDRWGAYLGYLEEDGQYFRRDGTCGGRVGKAGILYDLEGTSRGRIDVQGQLWDEHGHYRGYFARALGAKPFGGCVEARPQRPPLRHHVPATLPPTHVGDTNHPSRRLPRG